MAFKTWSTGEALLASDLNNNFLQASGPLPFVFTNPLTVNNTISQINLNGNTTAYVGAFFLPSRITVAKLHFYVSTYTATGTVKVGVYSSDGQTQEIAVTSSTISGTGLVTLSVSSVALASGLHYLVSVPTGTTNVSVRSIAPQGSYNSDGFNNPSSEPVAFGTMTVTAGTLPSTFNPVSGITAATQGLVLVRFDN